MLFVLAPNSSHPHHRSPIDKAMMLLHIPDAAPIAGDDALDAAWFSAEDIEAARRGHVTPGVPRVVRRAELLHRAGCLPLPAVNPRWLDRGSRPACRP